MEVVDRIREVCVEAGFDLVHPFSRGDGRLSVLIANSRALWPKLIARADLSVEHPLNRYLEETLETATEGVPCRIRYAHVAPYIPIQQIAHEAGFARLGRTHLNVHPVFGPWIALRAVLDLDRPGPPNPPASDPCGDCDCATLLPDPSAGWEAWLAVRDACAVGQAHRYSEDQIRYHYQKDRRFLRYNPKE